MSGMHIFDMCTKEKAQEACITAVQLHRMFRSRIPVHPDGKSWPHDAETGDAVNNDLGMHIHPLHSKRAQKSPRLIGTPQVGRRMTFSYQQNLAVWNSIKVFESHPY